MAVLLYATEYANLESGSPPIAQWPPLVQQAVAIGAISTNSLAFSAATYVLRLVADADCLIDIGATPDATASKVPIIARIPEYVGVDPGHRIAVIQKV